MLQSERLMQQLERSRVESNLLHKDVLKERDKQLQNHLIDFNNEPLAMDAPPLGLSVPLHQSRVLPAIPPTQTLPSWKYRYKSFASWTLLPENAHPSLLAV